MKRQKTVRPYCDRVSGVWNFCPQCGRTVVKP